MKCLYLYAVFIFLIIYNANAFELLFADRIDYYVGRHVVSLCMADFDSDGVSLKRIFLSIGGYYAANIGESCTAFWA